MTYTLADHCIAIVDCEHKTAPEGDGFALSVGTRAMKSGRLVVDACKPVSEATYEAWIRRMRPQPGDLILAREAPVGQVVVVPESPPLCLGQRTVLIRADATAVDPRFLHYWLLGPVAQDLMSAQAAGATVPHLNVEDIRNLDVSGLPPDRRLQRYAAVSLGALDELIENNRRRIELLEQMAQAIYREWFIHFRYPGHEGEDLVDSEFGPIPAGWEAKALGELVTVDKGLSYKGVHLTEDGVPMANLKCFRPGGGFRRDGTKPYSGPFKPKHEVVAGDLIVANTDLTQAGSVIGSPAIVPRKGFESGGIISHHLFAVRCPDRELLPWLFQVLDDNRFRDYARGVASGTTVLGFRPDDLLAYRVVCPPVGVTKGYCALAGDAVRLVEDLNEASEELGAIRDLLLPKLVTGEIDVSELDLDALMEGAGA